MDERVALNRAAWDERVPIHLASEFYDVASFVDGRCSLHPFELDEVGPVDGLDLVHLQCHFGQDTLSWARHGARAVGLDFSEPAVEAARSLAQRCGLEAEFVCADVHDALDVLGAGRFDIVYTGLGALVWLPDLTSWARTVAGLLRPGGFVYLAEFHPVADIFGWHALVVEHDYFADPDGVREEQAGTYTDGDTGTTENVTWEWTHPVSEVISALLDAGLVLELFTERDETLWQRWPFLLHDPERRTWRLPPATPRLPLLYTVRARRPSPA
jgi:SAM-dependent methyltransferase